MFQDTQQQPQQQPAEQQTPSAGQPAETPTAQPQTSPTPTPPPAPTTPPPPPVHTTQEERVWSAIGYIAFLGLLTLAMMPKSEFCKKHAAHGLTIFSVWFVALIAALILLWPFPAVFVSMVEGLLFLGLAALSVLGIIKSVQSYDMNIPVLTPIALKFPVNAIIGTITGKTPETKEPSQPTQNPPPGDQQTQPPQEPKNPQ
ncbi:hypothetical protein JW911_00725 [Candidatus Peregrinibacteria bacterium]|nr:hypothetical protein [Candidatus Peregrinibacteria bacterium]